MNFKNIPLEEALDLLSKATAVLCDGCMVDLTFGVGDTDTCLKADFLTVCGRGPRLLFLRSENHEVSMLGSDLHFRDAMTGDDVQLTLLSPIFSDPFPRSNGHTGEWGENTHPCSIIDWEAENVSVDLDTDTGIQILGEFIQQHTTPEAFQAWVRAWLTKP